MSKIYYTINWDCYDDSNELNGNYTINCYQAVDKNNIVKLCELFTNIDSPYTKEEEIQEWLNNEGDNKEYEFIRLF